MATILSRQRANGTTAHMAQIVIKRAGKIVHRENKTFDKKQAAYAWAAGREDELSAPGALTTLDTAAATLGDAIHRYIEASTRIGRTKAQVLRTLLTFPIASMQCKAIGSQHLLSLGTALGKERKPQTVANYLSHLAAVFAIARPAWGYPLDTQAMNDALQVARRLGTTGKSTMRERRPTLDELDLLLSHFQDRHRLFPQSLPMHRVIAFALFSTRRMQEITSIKWADLEPEHKRVLVRNMKNPLGTAGNHVWCDLPEQALAIAEAMPRKKPEIFPYGVHAITANFTRACKLLGIEDLHFHDLRHEGVSRLFEQGLSIPLVASVSGHRSWQSLKRYTHIRQSGDKYQNWHWLPVVTEAHNADRHS